MNDIFDKIIAREIPAEIVYEDDLVIAFLDIRPINHGHTLIVPKKKFVNIFDADPEVFGHMAKVAQKVAVTLRSITHCDGANILMNNEAAAGQEVFHAHMHVIPRMTGDGAYQAAKHVDYDVEEAKKIAELLKVTLQSI